MFACTVCIKNSEAKSLDQASRRGICDGVIGDIRLKVRSLDDNQIQTANAAALTFGLQNLSKEQLEAINSICDESNGKFTLIMQAKDILKVPEAWQSK